MVERNKAIDIFKGLGIMLIVIGHLTIPKQLYNFIYMFHVPAFFFVAGMTFTIKNNESFLLFLKKKAYRLLIPYLLFVFIISLTQLATQWFVGETSIFNSFFTINGFLRGLLDIVLCGGIEGTWVTVGPAWFLFVLFIACLLYWLLNKLKISKIVTGAGIIAIYILLLLLHVTDNVPFKLGQSVSAMFFMWCGTVFNNGVRPMVCRLKNWVKLLVAVIGFVLVFLTTWWLNDSINMMGNYFTVKPILASVVSLCGCASLYLFSALLEDTHAKNILCFYGLNSMLILGIHFPLKNMLRLVFSRFGLTAGQSSIPTFLFVLLLIVPLAYLVNKYFPFLVGQKRIKVKK